MNKTFAFSLIAILLFGAGVFYALNKSVDDRPVAQQVQEEPEPVPDQEVTYKITFEALWSEDAHLASLPPDPHFSPQVVTASSEPDQLFSLGQAASEGIRIMAETGPPQKLLGELGANSKVSSTIVGSRLDSPGVVDIELTTNLENPFLGFVTMIAPSPDWFLGVSGYNLLQEGDWVDQATIDLIAYDAGTDSGRTFTARNSTTKPQGLISLPQDVQLQEALTEGLFGRLMITRVPLVE